MRFAAWHQWSKMAAVQLRSHCRSKVVMAGSSCLILPALPWRALGRMSSPLWSTADVSPKAWQHIAHTLCFYEAAWFCGRPKRGARIRDWGEMEGNDRKKHLHWAPLCFFCGSSYSVKARGENKGRSELPENSWLIPQLTKDWSLIREPLILNTSYWRLKNGQRKTSAHLMQELSFWACQRAVRVAGRSAYRQNDNTVVTVLLLQVGGFSVISSGEPVVEALQDEESPYPRLLN